jgi:hypothetical protein
MTHMLACRLMMIGTALLVMAHSVGQQSSSSPQGTTAEPGTPNLLSATLRFEGKAVIKPKAGRPQELSVALRSWGIHGQQHIEKFPEQGFVLVHLHSGKVITVINGKEEPRKGGDFWTIPAGATMSVQVKSESALLQTFALKR